jgi:hypothetical protein
MKPSTLFGLIMAPNDNSSIPSWQRATSLPGAEDVKAEAEEQTKKAEETEQTHEASRSEGAKSKDDIDGLRDQAHKFLNDPSIKDAPRERKVAFLESKGLKQEEIDLLLSSQPSQAQTAVSENRSVPRISLTTIAGATCSITSTSRRPTCYHISRVPRPLTETATTRNQDSPRKHGICHRGYIWHTIRALQVHHKPYASTAIRRTA